MATDSLENIEKLGSELLDSWIPFLSMELLGKELSSWITAGVSGLALFFLLLGIKFWTNKFSNALAKSSKTQIVAECLSVIGSTSRLVLLTVSLACMGTLLPLTDISREIIHFILALTIIAQVAAWLSRFANIFVNYVFRTHAGNDPAQRTAQDICVFLLRLVIWVAALLVLLDNMGINITALVAGLGVGGIAVALAVQNILGDMLSSLSIVLDKPFEVGDFIMVGDFLGEVQKIGIKTTRVRSLSGEQLIFANTDLLSSRIRNYKRMNERRIAFSVGVTYDTDKNKLAVLSEQIKDIITSLDCTRFDRAHLRGFGPSSIDFEIVYYVLDRDYTIYMNIQQKINLQIIDLFQKEGIEFAFPSQTIYLEKVSGD